MPSEGVIVVRGHWNHTRLATGSERSAKLGKTTSLLCKVLVPENSIPVIHLTAHNGTLRVDPARKTEAAALTSVTPPQAAPAAEQPAPKPISR